MTFQAKTDRVTLYSLPGAVHSVVVLIACDDTRVLSESTIEAPH